jgi:hypothetical protein
VRLAAGHSADRVVDANSESLEAAVHQEAPHGANVVIDTTGNSRIFDRCLGLIHKEGRITMQGYYPDPISIDFHPTHMQRPTVTFPCGWDDEFNDELAEDMAAGRIAIEPLITHRIPFREAISAYELVVAPRAFARHGAGLVRGLAERRRNGPVPGGSAARAAALLGRRSTSRLAGGRRRGSELDLDLGSLLSTLGRRSQWQALRGLVTVGRNGVRHLARQHRHPGDGQLLPQSRPRGRHGSNR